MLYIIGLGLNIKGISLEGTEAIKKCKKIYLENYTVDFPYTEGEINELVGKKLELAEREFIEGLSIIDEAKKKDVALLVYGSPLTATTHITLLQECKESGIKCKLIYSSSIFDAVAESGLQLYKFGKIASMPAWKKSYEPDSFMEIVKENKSIKAHTLILVDIGLDFQDALKQLEISAKKYEIGLKKLIICQQIGTRRGKIMYREIEELREWEGVQKPYCLIIPGKLHHVEQEVLKGFG